MALKKTSPTTTFDGGTREGGAKQIPPAAKDLRTAIESLKKIQIVERRISIKDILFFSTQLSIMLDTGNSLTSSLATIGRQLDNPKMKEVIERIRLQVEGGQMLSTALGQHPKTFDTVFVSMIRAGETGGFLKEMLQRLVFFQKRQAHIRSTIRSALMYPFAIISIALAVILLLVIFVIPKFTVIFEGMGEALPTPTKILLGMVTIVTDYWYVVIAVLGAMIFGLIMALRTAWGRSILDTVKIRAPVVGKVIRSIYTSQLLRTLGVLIDGGVPLLEALQVVRSIFDNHHVVELIEKVIENVKRGSGLSAPFKMSPIIEPITAEMIRTGETSGAIGFVMLRLSDHYDEETEEKIKGLTSMLEPMMIVLMGVMVGFIAMAIILPIFKISGSAG